MREAGRAFVGMRDFRSFAVVEDREEAGETARSTLVHVDRLDVVEDGDLVLVGVEGSHFLWKMVRRMVGVLVEIGRGGLTPDAAARFLVDASAAPARLTAPPSGLFLDRVYYQNDLRDDSLRAATPLR
jgi:tRNA pseudouridine38-40 synthase